MNKPQWSYSTYDDQTPKTTHTNNQYLKYELERERGPFARLGSILGFATTILCLCVVGMIYALYFR